MATSTVSSCVLSIVASFSSGLDVFKKFRETGQKTRLRPKKKVASPDEEEVRLARSLRRGAEDIGREYQKSISAVGDHFAHGDVLAQTSLAEILLKLNTGLVTVINAFLSRDKHESRLDVQSLTSLSERSRIDTCRTLRALYRRLHARMPLHITHHRKDRDKTGTGTRTESQVSKTSTKSSRQAAASPTHTRVRRPMIARVIIADSQKPSQVAMVRPGERRKKKSTSAASSTTPLALPAPVPRPPPQPTSEDIRRDAANQRPKTRLDVPKGRRKPSMMDMEGMQHRSASDALRATRLIPPFQGVPVQISSSPQTMPSGQPLPIVSPMVSTIEPRRRNRPTSTYYSIASNSTKLGEIPIHKWAASVDFDAMSMLNYEAVKSGWPVTDLDIEQAQKRKRGGVFRLFRRNRTSEA